MMRLAVATVAAIIALAAAAYWPEHKPPGKFWDAPGAHEAARMEGEALDSLRQQSELVLPAGACYSSVVLGQLTGDTLSPNCK